MKFRFAPLLLCCLALTACGTMSKLWPFGKKPPAGPDLVTELNIVGPDGQAVDVPQFWKRNTLILDLSNMSGSGSIAARLPEGSTWPVRVATRVRPGGVGVLEVQGEQRVVTPVSTAGTKPIDIVLSPGVYRAQTAAIYISWGAMPPIVEAAPAEETKPEFVSPTVVPPTAAPAPAPSATEEAVPAEPSANDVIPAPAQPSPPPGS